MLFLLPVILAAKSFAVDGIVVAVDPAARTMLVSHRAIGRYMPPMMMPFRVAESTELAGLYPGARVQFDLVVEKTGSLARHVRKTGDGEIPPPKEKLPVGAPLPHFRLTDQTGAVVQLADLRGKVVAIDFLYTRCPLPDVCPRLAASFAALQRRFHDRLGRDLLLVSVTVDPDYDTPAVLAEYAKRWGADASGWRFLTGNVADFAAALGEVYWTGEGSIGHNSITTIVGRNGRIAAAVDGSSWRIDQLADLIARELEDSSK